MIKVGNRFVDIFPEYLELAAQIGVQGGVVRLECFPGFKENGRPDPLALKQTVAKFTELGMDVPGIEIRRNLMAGALRGEPERRTEEIKRITESMRVAADQGIDFMTIGFGVAHADDDQSGWRGYRDEPIGRAGTVVRSFDASRVTDKDLVTWGLSDPSLPGIRVSREECWERLDALMEPLLPVARETGIRIAFHPNDPPMPVYRGVQQLFTTIDSQQDLLDRYREPMLGLTYCCGTMKESGGNIIEGIKRYGSQDKIFNVHFRNVRGKIPKFQEVFQDDGDYDSAAVMRTLHEVGFDGYVMADHLPGLSVDVQQAPVFLLHGLPTGTRNVAFGWSVGYLRALIEATSPVGQSAVLPKGIEASSE